MPTLGVVSTGVLTVRAVRSVPELVRTFDVVGTQFTPSFTSSDARFVEVRRAWPDDRLLLLVAERDDGIVGGALGFRARSGDVVLRTIGLDPDVRGLGLGRRLLETLVMEAMALGAHSVGAGGVEPATKGFYERVGFHGRGSTMRRDLPPPGPVRDLHVRRLRAALGATIP